MQELGQDMPSRYLASVGTSVNCFNHYFSMQVEHYGEEYQSQSWGPLIALVKSSNPPAGTAVTSAKDKANIKETLLTVNGYIQVTLVDPKPHLAHF